MNHFTPDRLAVAMVACLPFAVAGCANLAADENLGPFPDPRIAAHRAPMEVRDAMEGPPDVCLLRAEDLDAAVAASSEVFKKGYDAPYGLSPGRAREMAAWLVVYFGQSTSQAPLATIEAVERRGRTVRVRYHGPPRGLHAVLGMSSHYAAWIPLGVLSDGHYALELYDARRREVTLMRRWRLNGAVWTSHLKTP